MNITNLDQSFNNFLENATLSNWIFQQKNSKLPPKVMDYARRQMIKSIEHCFEAVDQNLNSKDIQSMTHQTLLLNRMRKSIVRMRPKPSKIFKENYPKVFFGLKGRIEKTKLKIGECGRFPFYKGIAREHYLQLTKQKLRAEVANLPDIEREFFHLIASFFNPSCFNQLDVEPYSGSVEINALESWTAILSEFINEGNKPEKTLGNELLKKMQQAQSIALKLSYAVGLLPKSSIWEDEKNEEQYFKDFIKIYNKPDVKTTTMFFEKYNLNEPQYLPKFILMNEIAWDIFDSIHQMKENDYQILPLGIYFHSIFIEIKCKQLPSPVCPKGDFSFKIFNTGVGVNIFHSITEDLKDTCPLIYENLPREIFSYEFIIKLIHIQLTSLNIEDFYDHLEEAFMKQGLGKKCLTNSEWHPIQQFETCVYASLQVWIYSHLDEEACQHLEMVKTKFAIKQLKRVVEHLESVDNQQQELLNAKTLLQIGEKYLIELKNISWWVEQPNQNIDSFLN